MVGTILTGGCSCMHMAENSKTCSHVGTFIHRCGLCIRLPPPPIVILVLFIRILEKMLHCTYNMCSAVTFSKTVLTYTCHRCLWTRLLLHVPSTPPKKPCYIFCFVIRWSHLYNTDICRKVTFKKNRLFSGFVWYFDIKTHLVLKLMCSKWSQFFSQNYTFHDLFYILK